MATKRQKKKAYNTAKKVAKNNPTLFIVIAILVVIALIGVGVYLYFSGAFKKNNDTNNNESVEIDKVLYEDFQIHFLELGNNNSGDSVYVKAGDNDILIDAGSRGNSAATINNYVKQYCTDGKLEYVISTHGHQDHIAGFAGVSDNKAKNFKGDSVDKTGVLYYFEVETFIDFTYYNSVDNKTASIDDYSTSTEYGKYLRARNYAISNNATHYTAKDLWDTNNTTFNLGSGITMDILYNKYYFETSSDENNYSVCTLFNYNDHHFMLTGDLEKEGEEALANYYDGSTSKKTLPHCDLFKGGHHGSATSSNECLLEKITPDICCVCCCAGDTEYTANYSTQFPTQAFIDRIAKYTSNVYVTTLYNEETKTNESMNGNIVVSSDGKEVGIQASNNLTKLKDTEWFNADIYVDSSGKNVSSKGSHDFYTKDTPGVTKVKRRIWPANGVT